MKRTHIGTMLLSAAMILSTGKTTVAQDTAPVTSTTTAKEARPATHIPVRPKPTLQAKPEVPAETPAKTITVPPANLRRHDLNLKLTPPMPQPAGEQAPPIEKAPGPEPAQKAPEPPHIQHAPDPPAEAQPEKADHPSNQSAPQERDEDRPEPGIRAVAPEETTNGKVSAAPPDTQSSLKATVLEAAKRVKNGPSPEEARQRAEAGAAIPRSDKDPAHLYGAQVGAQAQAAENGAKQSLMNELGAGIRQKGGNQPVAQQAPAGPRVFVGADGTRLLTYPDGRVEMINPDGSRYTESANKGHKTFTAANGDRISDYPDGSEVRSTAATGDIEVRNADGENGFIQKADGTRTALPSGTYPTGITPPAPVSTLTSLWNGVTNVVSAIPNPLDYVPSPGQAASAAGGVIKGAFDALCGVGHAAGAIVVGGSAQWCGANPNGYFGDAMRSLDKLAEGTVKVADDPRLIYQAPVQTFDRAIDRADAFGAGKVVGETSTNAIIVADAVVNLTRAAVTTARGAAVAPEAAAAGENAVAATANAAVNGERAVVAAVNGERAAVAAADAAVSGERAVVAGAAADTGAAAEGAATLSRPLNVIGEAGPGVTRAHLEAVQQLANQTGKQIIVLGSRQTGIRASTGGRFTAASDLDIGVVGTADDLLALVKAEEAVLAIPNVEHGVMALQPTVEAALSKGWIVVVPW